MDKYSPQEIEKKWQDQWEKDAAFKTEMDENRPKYYALEMFPYPSGNLHMGHVRNYSIGDVMARYKTMEGFNVLHPMGFDSFGMPAENAAIKNNVKPSDWTFSNIENMKRQQRSMGLSYDWDREAITCTPEYYKWTQWLFELFYKKGLAYKKKASVNWCDTCGTVLANEQVIDGKCWRCDSEVQKKDLSQWFLKITDYADVLLKDLDKLKGWPERVKTMQDNWIGRSEGLEFEMPVEGLDEKLSVYTTRPDTAYGITFVALAAENPLVEKICENNPKAAEIKAFCDKVRNQSEMERTSSESEKEGIFTGVYAINPFNGNKAQLWVTNYVLADYGTGAVMGVPSGDQRDWMFAKKYDLPFLELYPETLSGFFKGRPVQILPMYASPEDYDAVAWFKQDVSLLEDEVPGMFIGHPGWLDDFILRNSSLTINRTREAAALSSPQLASWLADQELELLDYRQL